MAVGRVDIDSLLPDRTSISRRVGEIAEDLKARFLPDVRNALKTRSCAFDADMWTDKYVQNNYLCVTSQFINENWEMQSYVLTTSEFPADQKKDNINIRQLLEKELKESLGIPKKLVAQSTFVTDEGSNMIAALRNYERLSCTNHNLATVLRHTLDEDALKICAPVIQRSLQVCRSVVGYIKRSGSCKLLSLS